MVLSSQAKGKLHKSMDAAIQLYNKHKKPRRGLHTTRMACIKWQDGSIFVVAML